LFGRLGVNPLDALPPERRAELLANDFLALAAAQQDRASLEDVLPTMRMPCFLYVGEADGIFPKVEACAKQMPDVTFVSFPGFDHADAFYRADVVLTPITEFLRTQRERMKAPV
jgi:pimeloyl-ACP methyl ester carboxylesterase